MSINKVFTTLGASSHSDEDREINDYYATQPRAVEMLLALEKFNNKILEPACGEGHISKVLVDHGHQVTSYDLIDRGYGDVKNFFDIEKFDGDIVTNPPYKDALKFVKKSLEIIPDGHKVAMYLKVQFLEGKSRGEFFKDNPPKYVYVSSSRMGCAKNGDFEKHGIGGAVAFAWYIWEKGYKGDTILRWFN